MQAPRFRGLFLAAVLILVPAGPSFAAEQNSELLAAPAATPLRPFTGKVVKERVRLRLQPSLDSPIFQEMGKGDLLIVTGEKDDFYVVKPPPHTPAFVFRTYVLDDVVEGSHVNVRLQPDLESPILAQLNQGDVIHGKICPNQPKWLEIEAPDTVRFFVYKDYLENIGDESLFVRMEKRKEELNRLLETAFREGQEQLSRPFEECDLQLARSRLQKVVNEFADFPDQVNEATKEIHRLQEKYLEKKVAYLEHEAHSSKSLVNRNKQLSAEMMAKQERIHLLEHELRRKQDFYAEDMNVEDAESALVLSESLPQMTVRSMTPKMAHWLDVEDDLYDLWLSVHQGASREDYLLEQQECAETLIGIVEAFDRPLKNKPGDYLLVDPETHLPKGYLYSTRVDLETLLGQQVKIEANVRPNHHFAYKAYHVLALY